MFATRSSFIVLWVVLFSGALAQDIQSELEGEKQKSQELAQAMQSAQLLLSNMTDIFECDYTAYDVSPRKKGSETIYLVVVDVEKSDCDDMIRELNGQGEKDGLLFVSERRMPEMNPLPESGPAPYDEFNNPPKDYSLIHEVDPAQDQ